MDYLFQFNSSRAQIF
uniref:Uncharacterized protein n=1 Tax=Rhizophora mucronata TaxID=61149 RepID=A0A2P2PC55_RHIMU